MRPGDTTTSYDTGAPRGRTLATWVRRAFVLVLYATLFAALAAFLLPLLLVTLTIDYTRAQRWTLTRTLLFFLWYLACELVGVAASLVLWLASGVWAGGSRQRFLTWNYALQRWWSHFLGRGAFFLFDIQLQIQGPVPQLGQRPLLVFVRHASTADTVLASLLVSIPYGIRLRYVLKRDLLWDPCLDIVGNRLPNVFVLRDSTRTAGDIADITSLGRGLEAGEGVLLYPEGTRFSQSKKARIVARLREKGDDLAAAEAESFRHVLRPRSGGSLALLDVAPQADVLFLSHTGFEDSASFDRFFNGGLIGRTVQVELRVVPAEAIPTDREARKAWLTQNWREVDDFIEHHQHLTHRAAGAQTPGGRVEVRP